MQETANAAVTQKIENPKLGSTTSRSTPLMWAQIIQSVLTSLAILVAGWWFIQRSAAVPRLDIKPVVQRYELSKDSSLLRINAELRNVGSVEYVVKVAQIRVSQVKPLSNDYKKRISDGIDLPADAALDAREYSFYTLEQKKFQLEAERFIRAQETETVSFDILIPGDVDICKIEIWVGRSWNQRGWMSSMFHKRGSGE